MAKTKDKTPKSKTDKGEKAAKKERKTIQFGVAYLVEKLGKPGPEVRRRLRKLFGKAPGVRYDFETQEKADAVAEQIANMTTTRKSKKSKKDEEAETETPETEDEDGEEEFDDEAEDDDYDDEEEDDYDDEEED